MIHGSKIIMGRLAIPVENVYMELHRNTIQCCVPVMFRCFEPWPVEKNT